jgi:hypothetical protein
MINISSESQRSKGSRTKPLARRKEIVFIVPHCGGRANVIEVLYSSHLSKFRKI